MATRLANLRIEHLFYGRLAAFEIVIGQDSVIGIELLLDVLSRRNCSARAARRDEFPQSGLSSVIARHGV
jgi:hypothetical protein